MAILLYTRRGCRLCEEAEDIVSILRADARLVDVDADPAAGARYGMRVPVLEVDGLAVLEGRFDGRRAASVLAGAGRLTAPD